MDCILTINIGSSSLKFAIFQANKILTRICTGHADIHKKILSIKDQQGNLTEYKESYDLSKPRMLFKWIKQHYSNLNIIAIGHRVVHGGQKFTKPVLISRPIFKKLKSLIPFAPLHMPSEISFIEKALHDFPEIITVACFDTAFHRSLPRLATLFAIPRKYIEKLNIIKYGFHGLSYEYVTNILPNYIKNSKNKKIIAAHLGNGASICAIHKGKSIATSMGFSTLDGLMMGTRCGNIDPGVIIYLMEEQGLSIEEIKEILYNKSGLLGISNITGDVKQLTISKNPNAKEALDLFCYYAISEIGKLIAMLQGLDILVFTGGMGIHAPVIRDKICQNLKWLGLEINKKKNNSNSNIISTSKSKIEICVIPTDEELIIAKHTFEFIK